MTTSSRQEPVRLLIADDEVLLAQRLGEFLGKKGFVVKYAHGGEAAIKQLESFAADIVLYDLMLPELNALEFLRRSQRMIHDYGTKVVVVSGHNDPRNIQECMRSGAVDTLPKPYRHADVLARLIVLLRARTMAAEYRATATSDTSSAQYFIHLTDLTIREALKGAPVEEALFHLVGMVGFSFGAVRTSLIRCEAESNHGIVVASNDKRNIDRLAIELRKYPEVQFVLNSEKLLALDNLGQDTTMQFVSRLNKSIAFNSMILAPIRVAGRTWGVLSMRMPESRQQAFSTFELRYAQLAANVMGMVLLRDPEFLNLALPDSDEDPVPQAA